MSGLLLLKSRVDVAFQKAGAANCWLTLCVVLLCAIGCSKSANYTPASEQARKAVEIALTAWKDGKMIGNLEVDGLKVEPEDFEWRAKKKLQSFEILEEVAGGDAITKQIQVKLTVAGAQPKTATYHVVGKGPLAVIRDKDFSSMSKM